ncbi:MAG: hypothetical protein KDB82_04235 [Planctomycetes bacterium]|nr:hypothetical protein [Planctomycetota bacterium]
MDEPKPAKHEPATIRMYPWVWVFVGLVVFCGHVCISGLWIYTEDPAANLHAAMFTSIPVAILPPLVGLLSGGVVAVTFRKRSNFELAQVSAIATSVAFGVLLVIVLTTQGHLSSVMKKDGRYYTHNHGTIVEEIDEHEYNLNRVGMQCFGAAFGGIISGLSLFGMAYLSSRLAKSQAGQ